MCYKTLASAWTSGGSPPSQALELAPARLRLGEGCPRTRTLVRLTVIVPIKVRGKKRHQQRRFSNARVTAFKKPPKSRSTRTRSGFGYPCAEKAAQQSGSEKRACDAPLWLGGVLETLRSRSAAVTLRYICRGTLVRLETHTPRRDGNMTLALLSCGMSRRRTRTGHEPRRSHHDGGHRQLLQVDQPVQERRARGGARAGQEVRQEARGQEARGQEGAGEEEGAFCRVPCNAIDATASP